MESLAKNINTVSNIQSKISGCNIITPNIQKQIAELMLLSSSNHGNMYDTMMGKDFYNKANDLITSFENIPTDNIVCLADAECDNYKIVNLFDNNTLDKYINLANKYKNLLIRFKNVMMNSNKSIALKCGINEDKYNKLYAIYMSIIKILGSDKPESFLSSIHKNKYTHITYSSIICILIIVLVVLYIFKKK
jgi:hypothetical protein